jgi:hypothetical protein
MAKLVVFIHENSKVFAVYSQPRLARVCGRRAWIVRGCGCDIRPLEKDEEMEERREGEEMLVVRFF